MDNRHLPWRRIVREKGVICRACAKYRECSFNIFISTDAFIIPIFHLLRDLLNVEVAEGDGLPDTICRRCVNKLVKFNEFRQIYVSSETELRKRSEFKWLLEEEVRPWEEFAEEESFLDDGSQGESAANLKSELNEIGIVHLVKEEEMERNTVTAEEVKKETDSAEDLDSGQTSTSNVDPYRVDRCNNIGGLTDEPEKESDNFGGNRQGIKQNKILNNPSCDPAQEEKLQFEYSTAKTFVVNSFPERKVKKLKKNVKLNVNSNSVIHSGVKPFKCNECGKMFTRKDTLKRHTVVHTGVKRFKCEECGKMFSQNGSLKTHSFVHTGVKRFKCKECGKMFSQNGSLKMHSVVHTGVKAFKCSECGKTFTQRGYLRIHSSIHSAVKPYKCDFCGEQFKWRSSLTYHLHTHENRNPSK